MRAYLLRSILVACILASLPSRVALALEVFYEANQLPTNATPPWFDLGDPAGIPTLGSGTLNINDHQSCLTGCFLQYGQAAQNGPGNNATGNAIVARLRVNSVIPSSNGSGFPVGFPVILAILDGTRSEFVYWNALDSVSMYSNEERLTFPLDASSYHTYRLVV